MSKTKLSDAILSKEILNGKMYLKKTSCTGSSNLYDVLSEMLTEILTERPSSIDLNNYMNVNPTPTPDLKKDVTPNPVVQKMQMKLFKKPPSFQNNNETDSESNFEVSLPNCLQLAYIFEQAGVGIGRENMFRIFLALKQLTREHVLLNVRFWGKIFGIEKDYFIAEGEFPMEEEEFVEDGAGEKAGNETPEEAMDYGLINGGPMEMDDIPKSTWKPPPPVPNEPHHTGVNKKVFFVCNTIGEKWVKLPHVSPIEITTSREITKLLTGNLDAPIVSNPPFPGNEGNYLRALIARITAATNIGPSGYFTFGEEEEDDDDEQKDSFSANPEYVGLSLGELVDPSMTGWVHITPYILPQGRCKWFDPSVRLDGNIEDEFEDDFDHERTAISETGPRLLSSVADDKGVQTHPAWSTNLSSIVLPRYALAIAKSNNWPGAYAFAMGKMFENVYVGWGRKYSCECYTPARPPTMGDEYPYGPEVTEVDDPDVETEKAVKAKELAAMRAADDLEENQPEEDEDE